MANKIIQWNCRGLKPNYNELLLLIMGLCPAVICLQETFLKAEDNKTIKDFTLYNFIKTAGERASGGTSILINNKIPQSAIHLNTTLQAVAVSATLHKTITLCSIYIPPNDPINENEIDNLLLQLPKPFILMGDFNSHNNIWGCIDTNQKGKLVEATINRNNLCLYNNNKSYTYLHPASGSYSSIDLTLSDPSIFLDYSWKVHDDTCGSDHFPIILENSGPNLDSKLPRWNLKKAKWDDFKRLCSFQLISENNIENEDHLIVFTKTLFSIAEECIPKTSTSTKYNKQWFNEGCKKAIRLRKAALRKFNNEPTRGNLNHFKIHRAKARRDIKKRQKNILAKLRKQA